MASKLLEQSVTKNDAGTWDFTCPTFVDSPCGPFVSTGWPTKQTAIARGQQHFDEHKGSISFVDDEHGNPVEILEYPPMQSLEEFRAEQGIGVDDNGTAYTLGDI